MLLTVLIKEGDKEMIESDCDYWFKPNQECMKITKIMQDNDVLDFKGIMTSQKRSCCGIKMGCLFK